MEAPCLLMRKPTRRFPGNVFFASPFCFCSHYFVHYQALLFGARGVLLWYVWVGLGWFGLVAAAGKGGDKTGVVHVRGQGSFFSFLFFSLMDTARPDIIVYFCMKGSLSFL